MFTPNSKVCARAACDLGTYKLALSLDDMIDNTMELQSASPFRTTPEQSSTQSSDSGADDEERHLEPFSRRAFQPYHSQSVPKSENLEAQVASGLPITTMMLRNIPNKYSQNSLLREINEFGFAGTYDFFYLPMDVHNRSNVGYAFINFETEEGAQRFRLAFSNHRFQRFHSRKIGSVCVAHVQGLTANLRHFENRAVTQARNDQYRPLVLRGHQRLDFDHAVTSAKAKEAPAQMTCPVERVGPASQRFGTGDPRQALEAAIRQLLATSEQSVPAADIPTIDTRPRTAAIPATYTGPRTQEEDIAQLLSLRSLLINQLDTRMGSPAYIQPRSFVANMSKTANPGMCIPGDLVGYNSAA